MAKKITQKQILEMNELYFKQRNYSAVARAVGVSPSTVKKYIDPNYIPAEARKLPSLAKEKIVAGETFILSKEDLRNKNILQLSDDEKEDIKNIWEYLAI